MQSNIDCVVMVTCFVTITIYPFKRKGLFKEKKFILAYGAGPTSEGLLTTMHHHSKRQKTCNQSLLLSPFFFFDWSQSQGLSIDVLSNFHALPCTTLPLNTTIEFSVHTLNTSQWGLSFTQEPWGHSNYCQSITCM